jgi:hypothetical protein
MRLRSRPVLGLGGIALFYTIKYCTEMNIALKM